MLSRIFSSYFPLYLFFLHHVRRTTKKCTHPLWPCNPCLEIGAYYHAIVDSSGAD